MNTKTLTEKIPDVYFDWYARFLPGAITLLSYFYLSKKIPTELSATILSVYMLISYIIGHILQPLSSLIMAKLIQTIVTNTDIEKTYAKSKLIPENLTLNLKVSKAYAESISMLSTFLALLMLAIILKVKLLSFYIFITYFLIMSFERAYARSKKITDIMITNI